MRVQVVGGSGCGKTTFARRLAAARGVPHVELDALHHLPGWQERPDGELRALYVEATTGPAWVADGNYWTAIGDLVLELADLVVWLDVPRLLASRRVLLRTIRRSLTREELWHGNRESLRHLLSRDPHRSILAWSWTQHSRYRELYAPLATGRRWRRVGTPAEVERLLRQLSQA